MSANDEPKAGFLAALDVSLKAGTFVKLTLGKVKGDTTLKKCTATPVLLKEKTAARFVFTHARKDVTENKAFADVPAYVAGLLGQTFLAATLFTTERDYALDHNKKGEARLTSAKPAFSAVAAEDHNRTKKYLVDPARPYLKALGVSQSDGRVTPSMYPKYKQICHFIEIVDDLLRLSPLKEKPEISGLDIGAGKGYLTFALYDYLTARLGKSCNLTGIEVREDLAAQGNDLAKQLRLSGLRFEAAAAAETKTAPIDLLIALHACDTATDDAIYQGLMGEAALIVAAPCCQHELAPQLSETAEGLRGIAKFGLFKQRQADLVTDAARCLLLEASGYKTKVIEFVSIEHTSKNLLIAAMRDASVNREAAWRDYGRLKELFGFKTHHLEKKLKS